MSTLDPLSDVLRVFRVGGSLVLNDTYPLPWSVQVPAADRLAELTRSPSGRVVAFHLVQRGWLEMTDVDGSTIEAGRGDLLVCFGGERHQLGCGAGAEATCFESLIGLADDPDDGVGPDKSATRLLCGVFSLGAFDATTFADALPRVVHVKSGEGGTVETLAQLLAVEVGARRPGMDFTIDRILELICAEALRIAAERASPDRPSWLHALTDPAVFAAMSAVHGDPMRQWDVSAIARAAAMSPSRLTARFRETLGQSPMAYVTQWRMIVAAQLLTDTDITVQRIAERVGYNTQPSFTRSFSRHYGSSPRAYRKQARARSVSSVNTTTHTTGDT